MFEVIKLSHVRLGPRPSSVVEGVPADGAPALLIVENEFADSSREVLPLPFAFLGPSLRSVVGWDAHTCRPDGVRRSAQLMGRDVRYRCRLARRQCSELRWVRHPARRGIGLESRLACVTPTHLTADPGSTEIESVAGPAVSWLLILEQMQHVLGAQECPISQQLVGFVRESAPATDGDQPRIALLRKDRHAPIPTIHTSYVGESPYRLRLSTNHQRIAKRHCRSSNPFVQQHLQYRGPRSRSDRPGGALHRRTQGQNRAAVRDL